MMIAVNLEISIVIGDDNLDICSESIARKPPVSLVERISQNNHLQGRDPDVHAALLVAWVVILGASKPQREAMLDRRHLPGLEPPSDSCYGRLPARRQNCTGHHGTGGDRLGCRPLRGIMERVETILDADLQGDIRAVHRFHFSLFFRCRPPRGY
ncbi:hypothetical protein B0H17DRAFT_1134787 [Mycena rosella]|uniref:Uncharacterized protein n=1 Tax=Mycena rosella TaxID=1033263 RepID=A0AAD7DHR4_MYCRO|nr:hypothetical protein B0H17DRAFT_1134787 [Mycena rosella]